MTTQLPLDLAFAFEGHPIHCFFLSENPAWIAQEVAATLGIGDGAKALRDSPITEKGVDYDVVPPESLPATEFFSVTKMARQITILYESGLYALVLRSNKPAAIRFTRWVIREVLPALREQGAYAMLPVEFQGEAVSTAQLVKLIDLAGRGNPWAAHILRAKGLRPAEEEVIHG